MGNLGPAELILIMGIALVIFGPKKLPEIGRGIGNALREFNKARNEFMETINSEVDRPEPPRYTTPEYTEPATATAITDGTDAPPDGAVASERRLEYPEPLAAEDADALPYGSDFHTEGDSQPSFRTTHPEPAPATTAANATAHAGEGKA